MRKQYFITHSLEYFFLALIFLSSLITLFVLPDGGSRIILVFSLVILYLLWSLIHHWVEHDLHISTILEYLSISFLILWVLLSIAK